jgi:hypothetical protein
MQPVLVSEIKNLAEYELERDDWRPLVMALKDRRRVRVGGHLTFLFENHDTVRYQIQEMIRIERIVKPAEIAREVETYNELIPAKGELSASLLIEYETPSERDLRLRKLVGLENHIWLAVGDLPRAMAIFDNRAGCPLPAGRQHRGRSPALPGGAGADSGGTGGTHHGPHVTPRK